MRTTIKVMLLGSLVMAAPLYAADHDHKPHRQHEQRQQVAEMSPEQFKKHLEQGYERAADKQKRKQFLNRLDERKSKMPAAHQKVAERFLAKHR
ncbi:hypothetical protein [Oceanimonas sp. MB9]|uniref:hypothetical protein n=1 Tax=Oceanimonas sp. MB9 TaxID=2588453 RepID=UPI0013F63331|nr:hypothetical protein [Oceanimonas sp. MB9]NHI01643.1 hypothetical protein [Oceanimonas sp. MB9]